MIWPVIRHPIPLLMLFYLHNVPIECCILSVPNLHWSGRMQNAISIFFSLCQFTWRNSTRISGENQLSKSRYSFRWYWTHIFVVFSTPRLKRTITHKLISIKQIKDWINNICYGLFVAIFSFCDISGVFQCLPKS